MIRILYICMTHFPFLYWIVYECTAATVDITSNSIFSFSVRCVCVCMHKCLFHVLPLKQVVTNNLINDHLLDTRKCVWWYDNYLFIGKYFINKKSPVWFSYSFSHHFIQKNIKKFVIDNLKNKPWTHKYFQKYTRFNIYWS